MFPRIRGPSRKPVCAATKRSAASATRSVRTNAHPRGTPPGRHDPKRESKRTQFIVFPACSFAPTRRYPKRIPPAVNASETAIRAIVFFPVATRGSRSIETPLETASMPVYVPPPME